MVGQIHTQRRPSLRFAGDQQAQSGAFFLTMHTQDARLLFGTLDQGTSVLNPIGQMVSDLWPEIQQTYGGVTIDCWCVLPDHLHAVVMLAADTPGLTLAEVIHRYQLLSTKRYTATARQYGLPDRRGRLWDQRVYQQVIHSAQALEALQIYVRDDPYRHWQRSTTELEDHEPMIEA